MRTCYTFLIALVVITGCNSSKNATFDSARVSYVSNDGLETLTLQSTDYGSDEKEAIINAERLAFQNIFFRGVPNSPYKNPMLGLDEQQQFRKNKDYLNEFYNSRMQTFINNTFHSTSKENRKTRATVNLTINMRALRQDLEANGLKQKFGL